MMHLIFVTTSYPDEVFQKGQEAAGDFVADFAMALSKNASLTVVAPSSRDSIEHQGSLTIRRFAVPSLPLSLLSPSKPSHWLKIVQTLHAGQRAVTTAAKESNADHIFALWALPSGFWALRAKQLYDIPYSIWALGSDIWSLGRIPLVKTVLQKVLMQSENCFADGYQLADQVNSIAGVDCKFLPSSRTLPIFTDKKITAQPPYRLAFLGRWHKNKGIDLLLESLKQLQEPDWQKIKEIRICGGGPLEAMVTAAVSEFQNAGYPIQLRGYLNQDEASDLLNWADYLLLPSRIESIPVIFSDAVQNNCPVISMPTGDLPRLMSEFNVGECASDISSDAFVNLLVSMLNNSPMSYQKHMKRANIFFNVGHSAKNLLNIIS